MLILITWSILAMVEVVADGSAARAVVEGSSPSAPTWNQDISRLSSR
jgi:hypothetical protein